MLYDDYIVCDSFVIVAWTCDDIVYDDSGIDSTSGVGRSNGDGVAHISVGDTNRDGGNSSDGVGSGDAVAGTVIMVILLHTITNNSISGSASSSVACTNVQS
jgi:hypothetical protein